MCRSFAIGVSPLTGAAYAASALRSERTDPEAVCVRAAGGASACAASEHEENDNKGGHRNARIEHVALATAPLGTIDAGIKLRSDDRRFEFVRGGIGTSQGAARPRSLSGEKISRNEFDGARIPHKPQG